MSVQRCPQCSRVVNVGAEDCLACGFSFTAAGELKAAKETPGSPRPVTMTGAKNPFAKTELEPETQSESGAKNPFAKSETNPAYLQTSSPPNEALEENTEDSHEFDLPSLEGTDAEGTAPTGEAPNAFVDVVSSDTEDVDRPPLVEAPRNPAEAFLRTIWVFPVVGGAIFISVLVIGLVIAFNGRDSVLDDIDGSPEGARLHLARLTGIDRNPHEDLLMGHAAAILGKPKDAIGSYKRAASRGETDERAMNYLIAALDNPLEVTDVARDALADWPAGDVDDELEDLTKAKLWAQRHNAIKTLARRNKASDKLHLRVAFRDLKDKTLSCRDYKRALVVLKDRGKDDALDAIADVRDSPVLLDCLAGALEAAESVIKKRAG